MTQLSTSPRTESSQSEVSRAQAELLKKIEKLPPQYVGEVIDFVGYLQHKAQNDNKPPDAPTAETPKGRLFGCAKGKYQITESFFEPLEDFKDYM